MKKILTILIIALLIMSGCTDKNTNNENKISNTVSLMDDTDNTKSAEAPNSRAENQFPEQKEMGLKPQRISDIKDIIDISISTFYRESDYKDDNGFDIPPFKKGGVIFSLDKKPQTDKQVTLIPIGVDAPVIDVPIKKVEELSEDIGEKSKIIWFNVYIEDIKQKEFLDIKVSDYREATPFSVCCIYPAISSAKAVAVKDEDAKSISEINTGVKFRAEDVTCAIDIDSNNNPDIMVTEIKDGEYTISYYFIKNNEKWELFKQKNPM